jgi:uncharacterized OB-fold protein
MAERRPPRVTGPGHDEFWQHCAAGELRIQRCDSCRHLSWPPVTACEKCGSAGVTWERMSGEGTIASACTFERRYYGDLLDIPWETILVELDEGALFISNPSGFSIDDHGPGARVSVTFLDCEDDTGEFRLPVFQLQQ